MSAHHQSMSSRLRALSSSGLQPDAYLDALVKLADVSEEPVGAPTLGSVGRAFAQIDRIRALRARIEELEKRIRELESRK